MSYNIVFIMMLGAIALAAAFYFFEQWKKVVVDDLKHCHDFLKHTPTSGIRDVLKKYDRFYDRINKYKTYSIKIADVDFPKLEKSVYDTFFRYIVSWRMNYHRLRIDLNKERTKSKNDTEPEVRRLIEAYHSSGEELVVMVTEARNFIKKHPSIQVEEDGYTPIPKTSESVRSGVEMIN